MAQILRKLRIFIFQNSGKFTKTSKILENYDKIETKFPKFKNKSD